MKKNIIFLIKFYYNFNDNKPYYACHYYYFRVRTTKKYDLRPKISIILIGSSFFSLSVTIAIRLLLASTFHVGFHIPSALKCRYIK